MGAKRQALLGLRSRGLPHGRSEAVVKPVLKIIGQFPIESKHHAIFVSTSFELDHFAVE
jgi:hypothetical protein